MSWLNHWKGVCKKKRMAAPPVNAIPITTSQRVQRGTNRPSGNSRKVRRKRKTARKDTIMVGTNQGDELATKGVERWLKSGTLWLEIPVVTSRTATRSAIQSLDLRHAMIAPTTNQTNTEMTLSAQLKMAYLPPV